MEAIKIMGFDSEEREKISKVVHSILIVKKEISVLKEFFKSISNDLMEWDKLLHSNINLEVLKDYANLVKKIRNHIDKNIDKYIELFTN